MSSGDGQSGMGKWAMKKAVNDDFLYNIGVVPLYVWCEEARKFLYVNPNPGGADALRPLKKTTIKDTDEAILAFYDEMQNEIEWLRPLQITVNGLKIKIVHHIVNSMHDGKNIRPLTVRALKDSVAAGYVRRRRLKKFGKKDDIDYKTCRLCLKHSKHYNEIESLTYNPVLFESLKDFGCSPLHNWMRVMECMFKAREIEISELQGISKKEARQILQKQFINETGLRIYFPNPRGGNTNCGPSARRFFRNSDVTSKLLNCPKVTGVNICCIGFSKKGGGGSTPNFTFLRF